MAKKCCEAEAKKAIEHTKLSTEAQARQIQNKLDEAWTKVSELEKRLLDLVDEKHRKATEALYQQWEIERGKHLEEVLRLRDALTDRNDLIKRMARHMGRGAWG